MQILIRIELQVIIEPLLVIPVTAFHFAVMPRGLGSDRLVENVKFAAKIIQRMNAFCLLCVSKFSTIVRLNHIRSIPKVKNGTVHKVYGAVAAVLLVGCLYPFGSSCTNSQ